MDFAIAHVTDAPNMREGERALWKRWYPYRHTGFYCIRNEVFSLPQQEVDWFVSTAPLARMFTDRDELTRYMDRRHEYRGMIGIRV
jgi:hypothetical protein